jgi:hypothetical protein
MAITTLDGLIAAPKQRITMIKTSGITAVSAAPFSMFNVAGEPGAGTLAGTSTTTGTVPTDATAGCPTINAFGGGAKGYIARIEASNTVACRLVLYDMLWKAGAYTFNASTSGNSPTSFSSRVPGGTDYTGLELWYEQVTAGTGTPSVNVSYNNESGTAKTTGVIALPAAMIVNRMFQIPLAAGDSGLQGVTGVTATGASAGTFNLLVMRRLGHVRIRTTNDSVVQDALATGLPEVFADSALRWVLISDSASSGSGEMIVDIANG